MVDCFCKFLHQTNEIINAPFGGKWHFHFILRMHYVQNMFICGILSNLLVEHSESS
jgi:Na+/H+ antiporter NhaB